VRVPVSCLGAAAGAGFASVRRGDLSAATQEQREISNALIAIIAIHLFFIIVWNLLDFAPVIGYVKILSIMLEK
jgi:hypothetical protein